MSAYRTTEACPRCESVATTHDGTCRSCGHAWGAAHRCVHCGVSCAVAADKRLGPTCSGCGLPRIADGWEMSASTAARLKRAVARRRVTKQVGTLAILIAIACMPLGIFATFLAGFFGWLLVLLLWFASVAAAALLPASGRRSLTTELGLARLEREASTRHVRVAATSEPEETLVDTGFDNDAEAIDDNDDASTRRRSRTLD